MSLRQVLTIFNAERQLSDEETALLNTLRKMTDTEREFLGGSLAPQSKPKPRKKREVKSARASSLQQQIAGAATGQVSVQRCHVCGNDEGYQDHSPSSPNYHEFQIAGSKAAAGD